jgi:hypothetical protein
LLNWSFSNRFLDLDCSVWENYWGFHDRAFAQVICWIYFLYKVLKHGIFVFSWWFLLNVLSVRSRFALDFTASISMWITFFFFSYFFEVNFAFMMFVKMDIKTYWFQID